MSDTTNNPRQLPLFDVVEIHLTQDQIAFIDPIDADLAGLKWCAACVKNKNKYYVIRGRGSSQVKLHRLIMSRVIGRKLTKNEIVDHIDNNPLNNRRGNLRLATYTQNAHNAKCYVTQTHVLKGIHYDSRVRKKHWQARITVEGKTFSLGYYETAEDAHSAYAEAARRFFGEFGRAK